MVVVVVENYLLEGFPLPLGCGMKRTQWLFWGSVQTRQLWEKKSLIAMINDNGLEESWDTAATYIILSHQSLLLPAPLSY